MKTVTLLKSLMRRGLYNDCRRYLSSHFISTPIFYVNGSPHLGHAHTVVLTDALHRRRLLKGAADASPWIFSTGSDEHGVKVAQTAQRLGVTPSQLCDANSANFRSLFDSLAIGYTDFVRTTENRHATAVNHFWKMLVRNGFIYKGSYSGWYSVIEEAYLPANARVEESKESPGVFRCANSHNVVEWSEEDNYLFRLRHFQEALRKWLTENEVIQPKCFLPVVLSFLDDLQTDLSVSRSRSRLSWGHPVPDDDSQTVYVWLDALVNYLTVAGYPTRHTDSWKDAVHVIGKDILKFHAVYWPAFLMAAKMPLPKRIVVHSHWLVDHRKMSKSLDNVVDPRRIIDKVSVDGLRYFLLAEATPDQDNNFSEKKLIDKVNAELCNTLANLLSRVVGKNLNSHQYFPSPDVEAFRSFSSDPLLTSLIDSLNSLPSRVDASFESLRIDLGMDAIMATLREANQFIQSMRPWKMDPDLDRLRIRSVLYVVMETLRVCGILLQPVVPGLAKSILDVLKIAEEERSWRRLSEDVTPFYQLSKLSENRDNVPLDVVLNPLKGPLYPRIRV